MLKVLFFSQELEDEGNNIDYKLLKLKSSQEKILNSKGFLKIQRFFPFHKKKL